MEPLCYNGTRGPVKEKRFFVPVQSSACLRDSDRDMSGTCLALRKP